MLLVQILVYASVLIFLLAVGARIRKYASAPIHLRWELYPVAGEAEKKEYGGSYFEELDWYKKPIKKSLVSELTAMGEEIFFLKGVYEHNRGLWYVSYPFHLGCYLLVGLIGLLVAGALAQWIGMPVAADSSSWIGMLLFYGTILCGYAGLTLALLGCIGLLAKRIQDPALRPMTSPADYTNLVYILALLASALVAWLFTDQTFASTRQIALSLIRFQGLENVSGPIALELVLFSLFLLYMPFTRMTHFFAKYFTYHKVRWEDTPNLRGGPMEGRIKEALNFGVTWNAPHIQTGKTWAQIATEIPEEEKA
jgi:nitrate reductase gamma subunit